MKKTALYMMTAFSAAALAGCSDFLDREAQDLIIPQTTAHYKELLQGDGYFKSIGSKYDFVNAMTDDIQYFDAVTDGGDRKSWPSPEQAFSVTRYSDCYGWQPEIEGNSSFSDDCFLYLYNQVMVANICLDAVDGSEGSQQEKEVLRGQASFQRSFAYLMLANLYARPYYASAPDALCVPLKTDPTPSLNSFPRATTAEIWGLIKDDVQTAVTCLKDKNITNIYEINYRAALVLAVRTALYMEDWDAVKKYGEDLLAINNTLLDITEKTAATDNAIQMGSSAVINFITAASTGDQREVVFLFSYNGSGILSRENTPTMLLRVDPNGVLGSYGANDRRKDYWFMKPSPTNPSSPCIRYCHLPLKFDYLDDSKIKAYFGLRIGEVYLSLAEAYARQASPDAAKAVSFLNGLRAKRIAGYTPLTVADFADNAALVKFVWEERRRELCYEELHRWWDLRRQGQPELTHKWTGTSKYKLEAGDGAYVLDFPKLERTNNPALGGNIRPARTPVN